MNIFVVEDNDEENISHKQRNRFRFTKSISNDEIKISDIKDNSKFNYDLAFEFLKTKDPDKLRVVMKKFLRKARLPFRDFDESKKEYFDKLSEFSNERIEFEEEIRKACEDYIEDIDPEKYDRLQLSKRNMNIFMANIMTGLLEEKQNKMKKKYTKKQITEAIAYWKKQLNESSLLSWQLAYDRLSQGESIPKQNKNKNLVLKNDKCGDMIVPDTVTIGELYDVIKKYYTKDGLINIEFFTRV